MWHHVLLQEVARKRAEGVMLGTENRTFHCPTLCRFHNFNRIAHDEVGSRAFKSCPV